MSSGYGQMTSVVIESVSLLLLLSRGGGGGVAAVAVRNMRSRLVRELWEFPDTGIPKAEHEASDDGAGPARACDGSRL